VPAGTRRIAALLPLAAAWLALAAAPAHAGTVTLSAQGVAFVDPAGEMNRVDVDTGATLDCPSAWCVEIEDDVGAPSAADPRCASDGLDRLTCDLGAPVPVVIDLGAGDDLLASFIDPADALTARGGPGADRLYGTTGATTLEGGDGDDALYPDDNPYSLSDVPPGPDAVAGGPGADTVWYVGHPAGVRVSLDGAADDGGAGEGDNVGADVEHIVGSRSSDVVIGSAAANRVEGREGDDRIEGGGGDDELSGEDGQDVLDGGGGADRLLGGAGDDGLTGGPGTDSFAGDGTDLFYAGNDRIDAVDGVAEPVSCGPGADVARVDAADQVANESQNACETIERATGGGAGFAAIGRATARRRSVRVRVSCPAACAGRLTLRTAGKVRLRGKRRIATLGRATFVLPAGGRRTVSVRLARTGRRLVRRNRTLKVKATAVSSTAPRRTAVRRLTLRRPG
jgi:hypothetical protein